LLIGLENLQWSDSASRDLLHYLLHRLTDANSAVLFGLTSRELLPNISDLVTLMEVGPLSLDESQLLIEQVSNKPLSNEELAEVMRLAEGNPRRTLQAVQYWQRYQRLPSSLEELALFSLASV
jgi:predicted ATPase